MPTAIGLAFVIAAIYCFAKGADQLFSLLIFSSLFGAASMTSGGTLGLKPYDFVACVFIARALLDRLSSTQLQTPFNGRTLLVLFGTIGVLSAFTLPFIFAGIPINDPKANSDFDILLRPPLHFGLSNVAQAGYLLTQTLIVFLAAQTPSSPLKNSNAFRFSCYFLVALVFIQFIFQHTGIPFPYSFFQNNPGYAMTSAIAGDIGSRVTGTFTEASGAGAVLAAFAAALLSQLFEGKRTTIALFITLMAVAMVRSSSSLAAVAVVALCLSLAYPILRFPWNINIARLKRVSGLLIVVALAALVIGASPLRDSILSQTVDKSSSESYYYRTARDLHSLQLAIDTHGIGVGLGSNRPSSLVTSLLSNTGLLGFLIFTLMYIRLLSNAKGQNVWVKWAGCAICIDFVLGGPDITNPVLWIIPALAVRLGQSQAVVIDSIQSQSLPTSAGLQG